MITEGYNKNNIFYKIINREVKSKILYEDEYCIIIPDLYPVAKVHLLIIPKAKRISFDDFIQNEPAQAVKSVFQAVHKIAKEKGVDQSGYRVITNHGADASQSVDHFHIHLLGGEKIGPLTFKDELEVRSH